MMKRIKRQTASHAEEEKIKRCHHTLEESIPVLFSQQMIAFDHGFYDLRNQLDIFWSERLINIDPENEFLWAPRSRED